MNGNIDFVRAEQDYRAEQIRRTFAERRRRRARRQSRINAAA